MWQINLEVDPMPLDEFLNDLTTLMDCPQPASGSKREVRLDAGPNGTQVYSVTYVKNGALLFRYETQITEHKLDGDEVEARFYNAKFFTKDYDIPNAIDGNHYGEVDIGYGDIGPFRGGHRIRPIGNWECSLPNDAAKLQIQVDRLSK